MKDIFNGVLETVNPKGGQGVTESIIVLIIVIAVVYMNITGIEVTPMVQNAFVAVMAWLFGRNSKKGEINEK